MYIAIFCAGYLSISKAMLLAQHHEVVALDSEISQFLAEKELKVIATLNKEQANAGASFVLIATATD
jgi:UDPglucose 6-dehydrogenase